MKKKSKIMLEKAINSLVLAIEHFNSPWDKGRKEATLIFLNHSFEMLLKASILEQEGRIIGPRERQTIGFDKCVRIALSGSDRVKPFISKEEALTIQMINGFRDAAQHHILGISEEELYLSIQAGVTLFSDILQRIFVKSLKDYLPNRVLPVSIIPPKGLEVLIEDKIRYIQDLLQPGKRKREEARAQIRSLAITDKVLQGEYTQPGDWELNRLLNKLRSGENWENIFPGIASIKWTADFNQESLIMSIRLTKKEGIPVHLVPEGTPGAAVVALRKRSDQDYYTLGLRDLCGKTGITQPKMVALVRYLKIQENADYFKEFRFGKSKHKRYSPRALELIEKTLSELSNEEKERIYKEFMPKPKRKPKT